MEKPSGQIQNPLGISFSQVLFWCIVFALSAYGVFFIYSTGYIADEYPVRPNWWRQLIWLVIGIVACMTIISMNPKGLAWRAFVWIGYGVSVMLLVFTLMFGRKIGGAKRWLAFGPIMLQPAEFANFFTLMVFCEAVIWTAKGWRWLLTKCLGIAAMLLLPLSLINSAPSFGNAFSILPPIACIAGIHYLHRRLWGAMVFIAVISVLAAWGTVLSFRANYDAYEIADTQNSNALVQRLLRNYHSKRLKSYLTPRGDWNERQSIMTLASGGPFGKGYLQGTMKSLGYLPRTVAPTDFIFSVIGEEFGFFTGCLPILLLYMILFSIGFHWAGHAGDEQACLRCVAVLMLMVIHVFINIGMTVRLIPVIGLPLPLLSYGGSFTLMTFLCLGVTYATSYLKMKETDSQDSPVANNEWSLGRLLRIRVKSMTGNNPK